MTKRTLILIFLMYFTSFQTGYSFQTGLYDDFLNNNNRWYVANNRESYFEIKNGYYYIYSRMANNASISYVTPSRLDINGDLYIEARFRKLNGTANQGCGIMFGVNSNDMSDHYRFEIDSNGCFSVIGKKGSEFLQYIVKNHRNISCRVIILTILL